MFRIHADCKDMAEQVQKVRGEYFLGKTVLEEPFERIQIRMRALQDHAGFSAILGVLPMQDLQTEEFLGRIAELFREKLSSYTVQIVRDTILLSDSPDSQPGIIMRFEKEAPEASNPLAALGAGEMPQGLGQLMEFLQPQKRSQPSLKFLLKMGEDTEVTLREVPFDEQFTKACEEFFRICERVVNGIQEIYKRKDLADQALFVNPTRVNPEKKSGISSLFPFMGNGEDDLEKAITIERPSTTFEHIGGLKDAKRYVEGLALALENPEIYKRWGRKTPKGALLVGPPGNGKTLLAKALANKTSATFYHVKVNDVMTALYGASEAHIDQIFNLAKENAPAIIFFDEIDALGYDRNRSGDPLARRVVSVLLQNIDGLEDLGKVIVLAATNREDDVDPALRRAGRMNRIIPVGLPDEEAIERILDIHIKEAQEIAGRRLFTLRSLSAFVPRLNGLSGADIAEIVQRPLEEKARMQLEGKTPSLVGEKDLDREIKSYERLKSETEKVGLLAAGKRKKMSSGENE